MGVFLFAFQQQKYILLNQNRQQFVHIFVINIHVVGMYRLANLKTPKYVFG